MKKKPKFLLIILPILFISIACSFSIGDSEPLLQTTTISERIQKNSENNVVEEDTQNVPTEIPTEAPREIVEPTSDYVPAAFEVSSELYIHPSGTFQLFPPSEWDMDENPDGGTSWISSDGVGYLYAAVTNTGYPLNENSFKAFIDGYEQNTFNFYQNYTILERDEQFDEDYCWVYKQLDYEGIPQYVASYYHLLGQAVYTIDYWVNYDEIEAYTTAYDQIHQSILMDSTNVGSLPIYNWTRTFTDRNNLYSISIPRSWYYSSIDKTNIYIDSFVSPDSFGLIENIAYEKEEIISKEEAGRIALDLLNNSYTSGAGDIKVTGDKVQSDGSERLDWTSRTGGYHGQSFFETRGTTFLMFSTIYTEGYDFFNDPFKRVISSYSTE